MSKTINFTGSFFCNFSISYFLLILRLIFWKERYFFVFGSKPMASMSRIKLFPWMYFFVYSTASGNCFVTFSNLLVKSFTSSPSFVISSLNPSYLYSIAAGFPTVLKPSSIFFAFYHELFTQNCYKGGIISVYRTDLRR